MSKKITNIFLTFITLIASVLLVMLTIKGNVGNPIYYQDEYDTRVGGPFEASNSTARYALTEAIVEQRTFFLNTKQAKFASPDVVDYKGNYLSIFTPGVSFAAVPFYIVGKAFGYPQLISFLVNVLFALINVYLVVRLAKRLGSNYPLALLSGFTFLAATNALPYAHTLTQHHMSATVILLATLNALSKRTLLNNISIGALFGLGLLFDIPNPMMMIPLMMVAFFRHFEVKKFVNKMKFKVSLSFVAIAFGLVPLFAGFVWYNYETTGSYTTLAQNIGRSSLFKEGLPPNISDQNKKEEIQIKSSNRIKLPFDTRKELNSLYILLISNERSWLFYSPVVLIGVIGSIALLRLKEHRKDISIILSVILINIFIYSLFGDPWGGWAFGPRYLIPSAALFVAIMGAFLTKYGKNIFIFIIFLLSFAYSIWVTDLGSITTTVIPPKVEAVNLPDPIPYTYEYNQQLLRQGKLSALVYNTSFHYYMNPAAYLSILVIPSLTIGFLLYLVAIYGKEESK